MTNMVTPTDLSRPNIVTACGGDYRVRVGDRVLETGQSAVIGAGTVLITNVPVTGYNWVSGRFQLLGTSSSWITLEELRAKLPPSQFVEEVVAHSGAVKVRLQIQGPIPILGNSGSVRPPQSLWGEVTSIHIKNGIRFH